MTASHPHGTAAACSHEQAQELLPWRLTGRLLAGDIARVDAHLRECDACRDDAAVENELLRAFRDDRVVEHGPGGSFGKLWARIEAVEQAVPPPSPPPPSLPEPTEQHTTSAWQAQRWQLAASIALAVALGVFAGWRWAPPRELAEAPYRTAADPGAAALPPRALRVVFEPSLDVARLTALLAECGLQIVDGPGTAGVFTLAPSGAGAARDPLARLRQDPGVRLAEPLSDTPP